MKTEFAPEQLADPATAVSEKAIRTCVHCGFCNATCPTYALLGDELDRIVRAEAPGRERRSATDGLGARSS